MHGELVAVGGKMPREIWSYGSDGEQSEKCDGKLRNVYAYPVVEKHGSSSVVAWLLKMRQCFTHTQTRLGLVWVWPGPEMDANPALIPSHLFGESGVGMDRLSSPANLLMQDDTNTPKQTSSAATGPSTNLTTSPLKRLRFGSIAIDMDLDHSLMLEHVLIRKSDTGEMLIDNKTQNMRHVDESLREQLALTVMMMPSSGNGLAVEGKDTAILATHVAALRGVWTTAYATAERSWWRDLVSFSSDWFVVEREVVEFHPPCHVLVEYRYKRFGWKSIQSVRGICASDETCLTTPVTF